MAGFISGSKTTFDGNNNDVILDLKKGLSFLNQRNDGIGLLKKIGTNGFTYANQKIEWTETALATRSEVITLANGSATSLTVANAYQYQVNNLLRCENEVMRVTAIVDATTLTIVRAYAGTTGVAHSAKKMISLGSADPEGANAPAGIADDGDKFFNYSQTFTRAVSLSKDEIAQLSTEDGNPMNAQIERRFIEINRELLQAFLYGIKFSDNTNKITGMGGLKQFLTSNAVSVGGAVGISNIDSLILSIILAGGDPKCMALSPYQKQKLDALDSSKQMLGKKEHTGGNLITQTWQSGVMDHEIEIYVDPTISTDELWILDTDYIKIGHKSHNGVVGNFHVEDASVKGSDREDNVIRGKYSARFEQEKASGYLYGLT